MTSFRSRFSFCSLFSFPFLFRSSSLGQDDLFLVFILFFLYLFFCQSISLAMRRVRVELLLLQLCALAIADVVYVTDLPIFTSLAPCAQYAVSYQVLGLTEFACPLAVTALESCACSQDNNSASVASAIASNILEDCDSTDTEDVASATAVFSRQATAFYSYEFHS